MTTGQFKSFRVADIWVDRDKRQRRELTNIEELAESIKRVGLIHPIVIQKSGELRVGERRFNAVKSLGWDNIPVQFIEDMDEHELQIVELEENIRREDLSWQDHCDAAYTYHQLRTEVDKVWTAAQTADALGMTQPEVSEKLAVAQEIEKGNERVADAPKYSVARGIVRRDADRKKASIIADASGKPVEAEKKVPLRNIDFEKWAKNYKGTRFNFIHCDFPYGITADSHAQGAAKSFGSYKDDARVFLKLIEVMREAMDNIIAESAHLMFWFPMDNYQNIKHELHMQGWSVNDYPLIWYKSDNTGILPDPSRGPRRVYETAFIASRGDRKIVQAVANVCAYPVTKTIHMSEKPRGMLQHFFRMFVDEYSVVLDPTCGSANALRVAEDMGANTVLGLEKSKEFYHLAKENYYADSE